MNTHMTKIVAGGLVFVGIVFFVSSYFVEVREKDIVAQLSLELVEQEKTMLSIAEITSRDGMDSVGESIIVDCKGGDRLRFDTLLSDLAQLNYVELEETENLFDKCASFYAQRKAMMVARFEREFEAYTDLVHLLSIVDDDITTQSFNVSKWEELIQLEKTREELYYEQVQIQKDIILSLKGENVDDDVDMNQLVLQAKNVSDELVVNDKQAREIRGSLANL